MYDVSAELHLLLSRTVTNKIWKHVSPDGTRVPMGQKSFWS